MESKNTTQNILKLVSGIVKFIDAADSKGGKK